MPDLVDTNLILEAAPLLRSNGSAVGRLQAAVNGQIQRVAPCLASAPDALRAEAIHIVFEALKALADAPPPWLESETNGPFGSKFRPLPVGVLSRSQEDALRDLCGANGQRGASRASFPDAEPIDDLFAHRRRLGS